MSIENSLFILVFSSSFHKFETLRAKVILLWQGAIILVPRKVEDCVLNFLLEEEVLRSEIGLELLEKSLIQECVAVEVGAARQFGSAAAVFLEATDDVGGLVSLLGLSQDHLAALGDTVGLAKLSSLL
jgi:hypothetical protein